MPVVGLAKDLGFGSVGYAFGSEISAECAGRASEHTAIVHRLRSRHALHGPHNGRVRVGLGLGLAEGMPGIRMKPVRLATQIHTDAPAITDRRWVEKIRSAPNKHLHRLLKHEPYEEHKKHGHFLPRRTDSFLRRIEFGWSSRRKVSADRCRQVN